MEALGLIETKGFTSSIIAADTALKSANVTLLNIEKIRGGYVTVQLAGGVEPVQAAVDAAVNAIQPFGMLVSSHVIPKIYEETKQLVNVKTDRDNYSTISNQPSNDSVKVQSKKVDEPERSKQLGTNTKPESLSNERSNSRIEHKKSIENSRNNKLEEPPPITKDRQKLEALTVHELRKLARKEDTMKENRNRMKYAKKEELINSILNNN